MDDGNRLGTYLRARREQVTPEMVGLLSHGIRRVPGLRREELAMLAGVSSDYYLRLEQGRDRNPSVPVLEALARVLRLDEAGTSYLRQLASPPPPRRSQEALPEAAAQLLQTIGLPAFVANRYFDVLACNQLMTAVEPSIRVGANRLRSVFLDRDEQALHPDWRHTAPQFVACFRNRVAADVEDPRVMELVDELADASQEFRQAWSRHDVKFPSSKPVRMDHPRVGELRLRLSKLEFDGVPLIVYHPAPASRDAARLAILAAA
jgi:transcriptional regulator with XRE-family HTH domain